MDMVEVIQVMVLTAVAKAAVATEVDLAAVQLQPHLMHLADEKLPCACTSLSGGSPACSSRQSIFCV